MEQLTLILVDIDHFKQFNEQYGHVAGDDYLKKIASLLILTIKSPMDRIARYSDDVFIILLRNSSNEETVQIAKQIRGSVENMKMPHRKSDASLYVTVSLGIAKVIPKDKLTIDSFINDVDKSLQEAKALRINDTTR